MHARRTPLTFTDGVTKACDASAMPWNAVYLVGDGGAITGGVVTIQTCDWMPSPATPIPEAAWKSTAITINAADATLGAQGVAQIPVGAYSWLRGKLTTPITGAGTLTAVFVSNG